jgi:hypothetical protein
VIAHSAGIRPTLGQQLQHRYQEPGDLVRLVDVEMILFLEDVRQRPVAQSVDVTQLTFAVEDLLRPLAGETERLGKLAQKLNDLGDVVVVFAVFGAGLWVKEVVARYELKDLEAVKKLSTSRKRPGNVCTIAAILHTSVLAPHFAPRITSGDRYCLVWISFVK